MSLWNWATNRPTSPPNDTWVNVEQWWNNIDRGKLKTLEKILSQCHFVCQKSHMD
jgi:hypothetical protein